MRGKRGILAFGNRHIDLWDGEKIHGINYRASALWEASSALSEGLFLFHL